MTNKKLVVFDIDGVLLNCDHRVQHFVDGSHATYVALARGDTVIEQGVTLCRMFLSDPCYKLLFVTGRGSSEDKENPYYTHRFETLSKLQLHVDGRISNSQLFMRDWTPDAPIVHDTIKKPQMIEEAGYNLDDIFMVFEDRQCIVDMWRARGVTTYQTQSGDF
jgi:hypothetical protein